MAAASASGVVDGSSSTSSSSSSSAGGGSSSSGSSGGSSGLGSIHVPQVALFTMSEPDPSTTDGLTEWMGWFDGLKESIDILTANLPS